MSRGTAPPPTDEQKKPTAEQQIMFDCQAKAINSTEMKACAKYITD
jgi:hypothetical protein